MATSDRCRIDILMDEPLVPAILAHARDAGVQHYTLLPTLGGVGQTGRWRDDQVTGATAKVMLMAITTADKAQRFSELLDPFLETHGLMLLISDTRVVRPTRYS